MLKRLAGKSRYSFLDGFSGYLQSHIALEDQEKTIFACPFGTFAYMRMPFGPLIFFRILVLMANWWSTTLVLWHGANPE